MNEIKRIKEILSGLDLIETVTPDYIRGRDSGYSYEESEQITGRAVTEAENLLLELLESHEGGSMEQTIKLHNYTSVNVSGRDYTDLKITTETDSALTLEISNELAGDIMEVLSLKLNGFYIEDKLSEHEHELEEKDEEIENLRELLAEERLSGSVG